MIYSKAGKTIRAELNRGILTWLQIDENGVAREHGERFEAESKKTGLRIEAPDREEVKGVAEELRKLPVERFIILSGNAAHQCEDREWRESFARVHISLASHQIRVPIDLGGAAFAELELAPLREIARALSRLTGTQPITESLLLRPQVAAALWPVLISAGHQHIMPSTHPRFRLDGDGREIAPAKQPPWPNRYRPSYRARPVAMPFHLRAEWPATSTRPEVEAIGLVEPFHLNRGEISARLVCSRGVESFEATVQVPLGELTANLRTITSEEIWFPYGAGSYGGETVLLRPRRHSR